MPAPEPTPDEVRAFEDKLVEDARRLAEMHRSLPPRPVADHELRRGAGTVRLSQCFAGRSDLIVIHNMGVGCSYCTMWADGINGLRHHIVDRAALLLVSPDEPAVLEGFARERGWGFATASAWGTGFNADLGMEGEGGAPLPGVSTLHRSAEGRIQRIANEGFGPFDLFCPTWHLLGRLKDGVAGWQPKSSYGGTHDDGAPGA